MKRRILAYLEYIDNLLEKDDVAWENETKKHLVQIAFFAHERFVHLIVMVLFALGTIMSILYLNYSGEIVIFLLTISLLILLVPYIKHYYLLENSVQKMYAQYDKMINKFDSSFKM